MPTSRSDVPQYQYLYERPSAQAFGIGQCQVAGTEFTSNGVSWSSVPRTVIARTDGWIVPSLITGDAATYSQSGTTITVTSTGHNIPATTHNGKSVYLKMGAASTGATIPAGWFTNFTYLTADTFSCTSTTSQTGTGAVLTNTAETVITDLSITIPGGSLGLNGYIDSETLFSCNASSGQKKMFARLNTTGFKSQASISTTVCSNEFHRISNQNSAAKQVFFNAGSSGQTGNSTGATGTSTVDTTVDQNLTHSVIHSAASDFCAVERVVVTISSGF